MLDHLSLLYRKFFAEENLIFDLVVLILAWIVLSLLVGIHGEFPINDDWLYAKSVLILRETGTIRLMNIISMTLLSNVIWGSLFTTILGFSFVSLRISTLFISLATIIIFYLLLKELGVKRQLSMFLTFLIIFNPVFFSLSFTFMTENFFLASCLFSAYFYIKYLKKESFTSLIIAVGFSIIATLSRQIALFLPLSFGIALFITSGTKRKTIFSAIIPFFLCILSYAVFYIFLKATNSLPEAFSYHTKIILRTAESPLKAIYILLKNIFYTIYDIGFFLIPILPLIVLNLKKLMRSKFWVIIFLSIILLIPQIIMIFQNINRLPLFWNNIHAGGIGAITVLRLENYDRITFSYLPTMFWLIISILSSISGTIFISAAIVKLYEKFTSLKLNRYKVHNSILVFIGLAAIIYWTIFSLSYFFDRYFLILLPFILIIIIQIFDLNHKNTGKIPILLSCLFLCMFACFTVLGTIDFISWNKVRWTALNELMYKEHISPDKIDGGYEFNGWYCYSDRHENRLSDEKWWVRDNEYIVTFGQKTGYSIYREYSFKRLLPSTTDKLLILKRKS